MRKDKYTKRVTQRLKYLRKDIFHMTQKQLAEVLNTKIITIACYENGTRRPSMDFCNRYIELAKKYNAVINHEYLRPDVWR